jgi:hypothetical protein
MKISRSSRLAIAVLTAGLIMGGTGGAIATGQIGSHDIRNGAVTTSKLHNKAVTSPKIRHGAITTADLASSARGAKVVQYVASGASINANFVTVRLPGIWTVSKLGKSSWSVELVSLPNPGTGLFVLSQSAPAGEGTAAGFESRGPSRRRPAELVRPTPPGSRRYRRAFACRGDTRAGGGRYWVRTSPYTLLAILRMTCRNTL